MISIGSRIRRAILAISLASVVVMVLSVLIINEDLEQTMLSVEFSEERDFFLNIGGSTGTIVWETPNLAILHVPSGAPLPGNMPAIFKGLPTNTAAEITRGKETYLVRIEASPTGVFYMAKNITHFEEREILFEMALAVLVAVIIGFSLLLGVFSSRRIVNPLNRLSDEIQAIPVGSSMPRLHANYRESELAAIAETFNRFLNELESYVRREQSLLNLASHELRTPIAVISGALDVLEQRGQFWVVHLARGFGVELRAVAGDLDQVVEGVLDLLVGHCGCPWGEGT